MYAVAPVDLQRCKSNRLCLIVLFGLTLLQAFRMWRGNHAATTAAVRRALEAGSSEELRPAVAKAQAELAAYFQLKAACLGG